MASTSVAVIIGAVAMVSAANPASVRIDVIQQSAGVIGDSFGDGDSSYSYVALKANGLDDAYLTRTVGNRTMYFLDPGAPRNVVFECTSVLELSPSGERSEKSARLLVPLLLERGSHYEVTPQRDAQEPGVCTIDVKRVQP